MLEAPSVPFVVVYSAIDHVLDASHPAFRTAGSVLAQLDPSDTAVVMCSGRTRAELAFIQQTLGIQHPFVCEFGSAALIPVGYFPFPVPDSRPLSGFDALEFGRPYAEVVGGLRRTASRLGIEVVCFSDMSIDQVAHECRLTLLEARLAKLREYSERYRVPPAHRGERPRLIKALRASRLHCTVEDPFDTVSGVAELRNGINALSRLFRVAHRVVVRVGVSWSTLGDGLLPLVDYPLMVSPGRTTPGSIAAVEWAETIVDGVRRVRIAHERTARLQA